MNQGRVLIVDDEADIALILKLHLEDAGFDTSRARDGVEALDLLARHTFDLVLLDIKLPHMSGMQVLEQLGPALKTIAVIMMTAHGNEDVAVECMKMGALDYVSKPFSVDELLKKVERTIEFNRARIENVELQHQLELERKKMSAILSGMADMLVAVDCMGQIISMNRAAEEIIGLDESSVLGKPIGDIIQTDIQAEVQPCRVVLATQSPCLDKTYIIKAPKGDIPVLSSATPLFGPTGSLAGCVEIIRNITTLKALEKEREEFVSMLTHDMKTPLTAVVGSVELVRDGRLGPLNAEQKEYLQSATESCEEIVEMIDNLLDVYRFESGKMVLAYTSEDIGALITKAAASFRSLAERSGIAFQVDLPGSLPMLRVDRTKIVRLFGNLLSNAFKFTPEGGRVTISAELVADPTRILATVTPGTYHEDIKPVAGPALVVRVSDTGSGIPPESLGAIFDKFVQAKQRREGKSRGTGLGLAFCRKVMDAHGGYIWVESQLDKGSMFTVFFSITDTGLAAGSSAE